MGIRQKMVSGFTFHELLVVLASLCVLSALAVPSVGHWVTQYRLQTAVRHLYAHMQMAKLGAVKENRRWRIVFSPDPAPGRYVVWSYGPNREWDGGAGDDLEVKTVDLSQYGDDVCFGAGCAFQSATKPPGALPGDGVSYNHNVAVFSSRATANTLGYVYLSDGDQSSFAVGSTNLAGGLVIKEWTGEGWE